MSKARKFLALMLLAASATLLLMQAVPHGAAPETYEASGRRWELAAIELPDGTVQVNTASLDELIELPGVGETIGQYIMDERESRGPFLYPEDLLSVRGIGEKTLENLRDWLDMTLGDE